jgi:ATPase involved in DNA repair, putative transmembrane protein
MIAQKFDWTKELEKTVVSSLVTSFGLDFIFFKDKKGGDVDTIHNVRQGIYATEQAKQCFDNQPKYDSHQYHSHKNYIEHGRNDKVKHQDGKLLDPYRNQNMGRHEERQLDHTISASEIHNDRGRVLAGLDGAELANRESNLNSTHWYINNLKRDHSADKFVSDIAPKKLNELNIQIQKEQSALEKMPKKTAQQRHQYQQKKDKILKNQEKADALNAVLNNKESMLQADKNARISYNVEINQYYYSSKFLQNTAKQSILSGLKMGTRQAIGLVLAEVWFELKEALPNLFRKHKLQFDFVSFMQDVKDILVSIWERVKERLKDILSTFKETSLSGILSSISTTLMNILFTTTKIIGKLIRELWNTFIEVAKQIFFNPENLSAGKLTQKVFIILAGGISVVIGSLINNQLNTLLVSIPFGSEISAFLSALLTGILTLGATYFLQYSKIMQKVWNALDSFFKNKYDLLLEEFQRINQELDHYLEQLAKIEFNFNIEELRSFSDSLSNTNNELKKTKIIKSELDKHNIKMPYEFGNTDSMTDWLISLRK